MVSSIFFRLICGNGVKVVGGVIEDAWRPSSTQVSEEGKGIEILFAICNASSFPWLKNAAPIIASAISAIP
jgi:hypothetical protein